MCWSATRGRRRGLRSDVAAAGPRQAEVLPQRLSLVLGAEQPALLQLGNHQAAEVVVRARDVGRQDAEAVARAGLEPLLHVIGDLLRASVDGVLAPCPGDPRAELADRELLAACEL